MISTILICASLDRNPKMYLGAAEKLDLPPSKVAMVAAHIYDLRAAASHGLKTVYVRRITEDVNQDKTTIKAKAEGGEVDAVVDTFTELAEAEQEVRILSFCLMSMMVAPAGVVVPDAEVAVAPVKVTVPKLAKGTSPPDFGLDRSVLIRSDERR